MLFQKVRLFTIKPWALKHAKSYLSNYYDFYVKSKDRNDCCCLLYKIFMLSKLLTPVAGPVPTSSSFSVSNREQWWVEYKVQSEIKCTGGETEQNQASGIRPEGVLWKEKWAKVAWVSSPKWQGVRKTPRVTHGIVARRPVCRTDRLWSPRPWEGPCGSVRGTWGDATWRLHPGGAADTLPTSG